MAMLPADITVQWAIDTSGFQAGLDRLARAFAPLLRAVDRAVRIAQHHGLLPRPILPGPHPQRDRAAFLALAARTTARHQRRNRARRHR